MIYEKRKGFGVAIAVFLKGAERKQPPPPRSLLLEWRRGSASLPDVKESVPGEFVNVRFALEIVFQG